MFRSQFFFLKNGAISSTAKSCGSRNLALGKLAARGRNASNGGGLLSSQSASSLLSNSVARLAGMKRLTGTPKRRSFSSSAACSLTATKISGQHQQQAPSAETVEAMKAFSQAYKSSTAGKSARNRLPMNSSKMVGYWLVGSAGLVFGIVILGGLTRLTESGLSITEWKPVTGSIPPLNESDWQKEFDLYRLSPEFKLLNANMTLEEFKFIYYMEWTHRLWGRAIGLVFVVPAAYFVYARRVSPHSAKRLLFISGLIGFQGFLGWWMVKSGLDPQLAEKGSHPRVSHYRLATHLMAAFLVYVTMIDTGFQIFRENRWIKNPREALTEITALSSPMVRRFRWSVGALFGLVFLTSFSGALVAGLDAGLLYNSFPYMGESIVPPKHELFTPLYASDKSSSFNVFWKNMLENPTTVQLNHRILATSSFLGVFLVHMYSLRLRPFLTRPIIKTGARAMGLVTLQAALGISTLVYIVPTPLASAHQAGSLLLLTALTILAARMRIPRSRFIHFLAALEKKQSTKL